jgi:DNA primase
MPASPNAYLAMIPTEYIDDLLSKADIVRIIGAEVALTKLGQNYFGTCPFHGDSHPEEDGLRPRSFSVSREKNFYHCLACNAHGSVINFYIKHRGVTFPIAVELLAMAVGAEPPPLEGHRAVAKAKSDAVSDTLGLALEYYHKALRCSAPAITVLKEAGISGQTAARYRIGFAPDGWENLVPVFKNEYAKRCVEAGLAVTNEKIGKTYDRLRNRVIFPTLDSRGQVVGLAGLALGPNVPEYLRTTRPKKAKIGKKVKKATKAEWELHDPKASMFGLSQANSSMHAKRFVVLVQDCLDVLRLHEGGVYNVVSPAEAGKLKPENVERLFRRTPCIICCFPSTKRGASLAWSTMKAVLPALTDSVQVRFAMLPDEQSPGDILQQEDGRELFQLFLNSSIPLSEYFLQGLVSKRDLGDIEGRAKVLSEADKLLATISATNTKALLDEAVRDLVTDRLELLDSVDEHDQWLMNAIATASAEVLIVSPWITGAGIKRFDLCVCIAAAVARGVKVTVYTDIEFSRERRRRFEAGELRDDGAEAALMAAGVYLHHVSRIHSKIVAVDNTALCIGSFNWLSAAKTGPYQRHEVSLVHRQGNIATRKAKLLAVMQSRRENT